MKIITWNCNMAFRKKAESILALKPDIVIVPECEHPGKLKFSSSVKKPNDILWFGTNQNKGLGVFSYSKYRFRLLDLHNPALKMIVPIAVTGGQYDFTLYAIWANNPADKEGQYVEQIWKAIHHYDAQLTGKPSILAGDFNSNTIWDRKRRAGNHSNVVKFLAEKKISSAYHLHHQQEQGKEKHPTYYLYRHADKPYHLDYCFVSADLAKQIQSVEIGEHSYWSKYSDHVPVIVTFKNKRRKKTEG